jgi:hypothetical protein
LSLLILSAISFFYFFCDTFGFPLFLLISLSIFAAPFEDSLLATTLVSCAGFDILPLTCSFKATYPLTIGFFVLFLSVFSNLELIFYKFSFISFATFSRLSSFYSTSVISSF